MNYGVYTYQVVDGQEVRRLIAYKMSQDAQGVSGFSLMTEVDAKAYAASLTTSGLTTTVLPLEPDQAITAF